jgi:hypothetical protein
MFLDKPIFCPVGQERLGILRKGEVCSYVCKDCEFIYTWDATGKLLAPVKLKNRKSTHCECKNCSV